MKSITWFGIIYCGCPRSRSLTRSDFERPSAASPTVRKRIKTILGWDEDLGGLCEPRYRGLDRTNYTAIS